MIATLDVRPWSTPFDKRGLVPWAFGSEVTVDGPDGACTALRWLLKRDSSIAPRQLAQLYAVLCAVSLSIAGVFFWQGAPLVLAAAGVELLLLGVALLWFARHASDREMLTLVGRSLRVEQHCASRVERAEFMAPWLTVEPAAGQGSLVELSGQGKKMRVGRFLRPALRGDFARELRLALRRACAST